MKKTILLLIIVLVLLLVAANPFERATTAIDWWAIGPSNARLASGTIVLDGVIGQGVSGVVSQASTNECSGYLCLVWEFFSHWAYLPLILK
jgi:hypothetical protein